MTANSSYNSIQNVGSMGPIFRAFNPLKNTSLFARINWVFILYVGCLAASAAYCLSNLYQAYRLKSKISFGVGDQFKLIKCQALLDEAQEKEKNHENAQLLFQQCELLLDSVNDNFISVALDKGALLLRLTHHYVKNDPTHSYQIAQKLSSPYDLFKAAESIQKEHPDFDLGKLNSLFTQAFDAMIQQWKKEPEGKIHRLDFKQLLKFAKAFHSVNNRESVTRCMAEALTLAKTYENDLSWIGALCQIAECYQQIGNSQQMNSALELAQQLPREKIPTTKLIEARLTFAHTFYSLKDFGKMDQELNEVMKLMDTDHTLQTVNSLYSLTKLITKVGKDEKSESKFKAFVIKSKIDTALQDLLNAPLEETTAKDQAQAYLSIVSIYHEGLIEDSSSKELALNQVSKMVQKLPENTDKEIESKLGLLTSLVHFYEQDPKKAQEILQNLEKLYDRCPLNSDSDFSQDKFGLGQQIMSYYNKMRLKEQSDIFFQRYLSDLKNEKEKTSDKFSKINNLVTYAKHHHILGNDHYRPDQRRAQLEAAKSLLPELKSSSSYELALAMVIEGYLQVDRQKSLRLLENYANQRAHQKAIKHLKIATITAITTGLFYFYPQAYPLLSLGLTVVRLF